MDIAVKQRILGGVILIAGAVLFLPVLLQGAGVQALQPPTAPAEPKTPTTAELAPALQKDAAQIEQDVSASHGEPTFYPVQQTPSAPVAVQDATGDQYRLVTPSAKTAAAATVAAGAAVAAAERDQAPAPADKPVEKKPDAAKVAAEKARADKAQMEKAQAEKDKQKAADKLKADRLAKEKADKLQADKAKAEQAKAEKVQADARQQAAKAASAGKSAALDPSLPQAWVVQVAVLSTQDKAKALAAKLHGKGFRVVVTGSGDKWHVVTGPELDKSVAESVRSRLAASGYAGGWVQAYRP